MATALPLAVMPHQPIAELADHKLADTNLADIDTLLRQHRDQVMRLATLSLRDADEAATITQDCFLRADATRAQFRGECSASTWLMQIAYNLIRDRVRTRKYQFWRRAQSQAVDVAIIADRLPHGGRSGEAQLLARERVAQVWAALETLSPRQRTVFVLRFVEEMELAEIVLATGMTLATVKTHLYRALEAVRQKVQL
jgi:RNA polymerase sigma-70 factor, ECF subfamily